MSMIQPPINFRRIDAPCCANLLAHHFGPSATPWIALTLVGLDLSIRDWLNVTIPRWPMTFGSGPLPTGTTRCSASPSVATRGNTNFPKAGPAWNGRHGVVTVPRAIPGVARMPARNGSGLAPTASSHPPRHPINFYSTKTTSPVDLVHRRTLENHHCWIEDRHRPHGLCWSDEPKDDHGDYADRP
jgi:hypothetical protein